VRNVINLASTVNGYVDIQLGTWISRSANIPGIVHIEHTWQLLL
jgi:hypothetical protein